jgi:hypothetical protein
MSTFTLELETTVKGGLPVTIEAEFWRGSLEGWHVIEVAGRTTRRDWVSPRMTAKDIRRVDDELCEAYSNAGEKDFDRRFDW